MAVYDIFRRTHGIDRYDGIVADSKEEALAIAQKEYPTSHEDVDWDEFEVDQVYDE
jgi:uncharacterized membrane protein